MKILWLATKVPWPPIDGGRLVAQLTLEALAERGHEVTVLAPAPNDPEDFEAAGRAAEKAGCRLELVAARPRPRLLDAALAPFSRRPWTIRRHDLPALRRRAREVAAKHGIELVHAEQVQALSAAEDLFGRLPVVLRAQNVESDLWLGLADRRRSSALLLRWEARRLAAWEATGVGRSSVTVTLTDEDSGRLQELATGAGAPAGVRLATVPAPFPADLPAGDARLAGEPPLVLFGSAGWWPNRDGVEWFLDQVWPRARAACPGAVLHLFGFDSAREGVQPHPSPAESRDALPPGAALLVPLFVASGVRMKILEAWARGVPVIASPAAARGLGARDGEHLLIASRPEDWAESIRRLAAARGALVANARRHLGERHAPAKVAERLEAVYRSAREAMR